MAKTLFTDEHEWLTIDGDVATVGITNHAQEQLGDLVYVELPQIGRAVKKGEEAAVVESVKAASDVYSPVSGEIVAVNSEVTGDPALVNRAPEGEGWLMKIRLADKSELDAMMDAAAYAKFVG